MNEQFERLRERLRKSHLSVNVYVVTRRGDQNMRQLLVSRKMRVRELMDELTRKVLKDRSEKADEFLLYQKNIPLMEREPLENYGDNLVLYFRQRSIENVYLVVEGETNKRIPVEQLPAIIGRKTASDTSSEYKVDLSDLTEAKTVSRRHARVSIRDNVFFLESLTDNSNTYINDERILPDDPGHRLDSGMIIRLGDVRLKFMRGK